MQAFGIEASEFGPVWTDKIERGKRGPNAGPTQLEERNYLLKAVQAGDRVLVADAYCLGISRDDVSWFVGELSRLGVTVTVGGGAYQVKPGGDVAALLAEVARKQNTANVAAYRAAKRGRKPISS